jgi:hypothetical protein
MAPQDREHAQHQQFEIGDEVIGDEHIRGTILNTRDLRGACHALREYVIKSDNGERLMYAGERNLQLVKKGLGDAAPPRPELMNELEDDLRNRPLSGTRF